MNINAGLLRRIARLAFDRTAGSPDRATHIDMDPIVAVTFSAFAAEAFVNELVGLARSSTAHEPVIETFARLATHADARKMSSRFKYDLAHALFAGSAYDHGSDPYQSFHRLVTLRDRFAHLRTEKREFDVTGRITALADEDLLSRFRSLNILADIDLTTHINAAPSLFQWFGTRAVARWACNVASDIVFSILDVIPPGSLKDDAEFCYRGSFRRVS